MNIRLSLSTKVNKDGCSELFLRIIISRKHVYRIKTGIYVPRNSWNKKDERITIPRVHTAQQKDLQQLQIKISNMIQHLTLHLYDLQEDELDKQTIESLVRTYRSRKAEVTPLTSYSSSFEEAYESFIKLQVKTYKRVEQYRCLWKQMKRFVTYQCGTFQWCFEIEAEDILNFENFLLEEPSFFDDDGKPKKEYMFIYKDNEIPRRIKRGKNAVSCIVKRLRIFFNWAEKNKMFTCQNAFTNYHAHQCVYGTPYFMTKDEIDTLYRTDFSSDKRLEFHRDLFVFQSNVGMRVGDLFSMTQKNIVNGDFLEYIPSKTLHRTGDCVSVPLTKVAREILNKYYDEGRKELFPFIDTHRYNIDIKLVLRLAGICRIITIYDPLLNANVQKPICDVAASHMARRNFIGNLYNKVADPNIIGSMTGHVEGSKAFARYRTIGEDLKKKALSALE